MEIRGSTYPGGLPWESFCLPHFGVPPIQEDCPGESHLSRRVPAVSQPVQDANFRFGLPCEGTQDSTYPGGCPGLPPNRVTTRCLRPPLPSGRPGDPPIQEGLPQEVHPPWMAS